MKTVRVGDDQRRAELDGLRGIAILLVIFLHWAVRPYQTSLEAVPFLYPILNCAVHGVDIFLVISGFLIGRILIIHHDRRGFFASFYIRRFFRIIPLYFTVIALFYLLRQPFGGLPDHSPPLASYFLFINNLYTSSGFLPVPELGPMWSLAIEEQFYITGALVAVSCGRRGLFVLAVAFIVSGSLYRLVNWWTPLGWSSWHFTLAHVDPLGMGMLTAHFLTGRHRDRIVSWFSARGKILVPPLLGVLAVAAGNAFFDQVGGGILLVSACTAIVIVLQEKRPSELLRNPVLAAYGRMCFSLYILHEGFRLYFLASLTQVMSGPWILPAMFVLLSGLCWFLWKRVETPLIAFGHRWSYDGGVSKRSLTQT